MLHRLLGLVLCSCDMQVRSQGELEADGRGRFFEGATVASKYLLVLSTQQKVTHSFDSCFLFFLGHSGAPVEVVGWVPSSDCEARRLNTIDQDRKNEWIAGEWRWFSWDEWVTLEQSVVQFVETQQVEATTPDLRCGWSPAAASKVRQSQWSPNCTLPFRLWRGRVSAWKTVPTSVSFWQFNPFLPFNRSLTRSDYLSLELFW